MIRVLPFRHGLERRRAIRQGRGDRSGQGQKGHVCDHRRLDRIDRAGFRRRGQGGCPLPPASRATTSPSSRLGRRGGCRPHRRPRDGDRRRSSRASRRSEPHAPEQSRGGEAPRRAAAEAAGALEKKGQARRGHRGPDRPRPARGAGRPTRRGAIQPATGAALSIHLSLDMARGGPPRRLPPQGFDRSGPLGRSGRRGNAEPRRLAEQSSPRPQPVGGSAGTTARHDALQN